jgi:hypothetical protein
MQVLGIPLSEVLRLRFPLARLEVEYILKVRNWIVQDSTPANKLCCLVG